MGFQVRDAVDDVDAGFFQARGPIDVAAFVESGLEFDQHRDLLAALGSLDQPIDDGGIAADAIQRDLDRHHLRIGNRGVQEGFDGREGVKRMVDQAVAFPDLLETGLVARATACEVQRARP